MTDGTAEYNAAYRHHEGFYYDLVKAAVQRMTLAQAHELRPHQASAVAVTPGWMRSEDMLDLYRVTEATWRQATAAQPHFCISESPAYTGRAVTALAADPQVARWSGQVVSSGQLARVYGFTDLDGTQPDCWRYVVEVQDRNLPAGDDGYRQKGRCRFCTLWWPLLGPASGGAGLRATVNGGALIMHSAGRH